MTTDWAYKATNISRPIAFAGLGVALWATAIWSDLDLGLVEGLTAKLAMAMYGALLVAIAIRPRRRMHMHGIWLSVLVFGGRAVGFWSRAFAEDGRSPGFWAANGALMAAMGVYVAHGHLYRLGKTTA